MTKKQLAEELPGGSAADDQGTKTDADAPGGQGGEAPGEQPDASKTDDPALGDGAGKAEQDAAEDARVKKANAEAQKYREQLRAKEEEALAASATNASLAERLEALEKERAAEKAEAAELKYTTARDKLAADLGVTNVGLFDAALKAQGDKVTLETLATVGKEVVDANPELVGTPAKNSASTGGGGQGTRQNDKVLSEADYRGMTLPQKAQAIKDHPEQVREILKKLATR